MMVGGRQAKLAQFEGVVQAGARFKPQKRSSWDEILPWVAPELVMGGRKAEQRSDVYSISCLIWEVVGCQVPWKGFTAEEVEENKAAAFLCTTCLVTFAVSCDWDCSGRELKETWTWMKCETCC